MFVDVFSEIVGGWLRVGFLFVLRSFTAIGINGLGIGERRERLAIVVNIDEYFLWVVYCV